MSPEQLQQFLDHEADRVRAEVLEVLAERCGNDADAALAVLTTAICEVIVNGTDDETRRPVVKTIQDAVGRLAVLQ